MTGLAAFRRRLARCRRGVTVIEFAIVAPVFLMLLMGLLDIGHSVYLRAVLNGAVQKAARNSSLETANTAQADQLVEHEVMPLVPGATITTQRKSYYDFSDIGRAERWNDDNNDGVCDNGESYTDENGNGQWDEDMGLSGNGGADDVVLYTVSVSYTPIFRIPFMPNSWGRRTVSATAVKKNQPFANQNSLGSTARTCND